MTECKDDCVCKKAWMKWSFGHPGVPCGFDVWSAAWHLRDEEIASVLHDNEHFPVNWMKKCRDLEAQLLEEKNKLPITGWIKRCDELKERLAEKEKAYNDVFHNQDAQHQRILAEKDVELADLAEQNMEHQKLLSEVTGVLEKKDEIIAGLKKASSYAQGYRACKEAVEKRVQKLKEFCSNLRKSNELYLLGEEKALIKIEDKIDEVFGK